MATTSEGVGTPQEPIAEAVLVPEAGDPQARRPRRLGRYVLPVAVFAALAAFRAILLPFLLAIFLAYMLYPVVSRIERVSFRGRRAPRWLAVILIYLGLFLLGWNVVPRVTVRIVADLSVLGDALPRLFDHLRLRQEDLHARVAELLAVKSMPPSADNSIKRSLRDLQAGALVSRPVLDAPAEEEPVPVGPSSPSTDGTVAPVPAIAFSLFTLQLPAAAQPPRSEGHAAALPAGSGPDQPDRPPPPTPPASGELPPAAAPDPNAAPDELAALPPGAVLAAAPKEDVPEDAEEDPPLRFDNASRTRFYEELRRFINEQLEAEGLAGGVPTIARARVFALNEQHLGLPANDPQLVEFAGFVESQVAAAIRPEEYTDVARKAMQDGLTTARRWVTEQLQRSTALIPALIRGTFDFFLILMLTAFFLISFSRIRDHASQLVSPAHRADFREVLRRIDVRLSGAIRGQVIICSINGFQSYVGLYVIGLMAAPILIQYAAILGIFAGILSLIPIFGIILATIPMVLLALTQSIWAAVAVVVWMAFLNITEAYFLNPNILGRNAHMNPILVIFALLAGRHVGGLTGALLAVPIASVAMAMFGYWHDRIVRSYSAADVAAGES